MTHIVPLSLFFPSFIRIIFIMIDGEISERINKNMSADTMQRECVKWNVDGEDDNAFCVYVSVKV